MASVIWPVSLPPVPLSGGFSQRQESNLLRSQGSYGPAKVRRQTTATIQVGTFSLLLTAAQKVTLVAFYKTDVVGGSAAFNWVDHLNGGTVEYRFTAPIQFSDAGGGYWSAVCNFEILP